ncbi:hypothetical protein psyc5s11_53470 [Clostridium gelidum]|uniref:DUF3800 domain-containing protein n=1 Tax=Clostridium gelidum TaxID=704125 RepID=A0ABM7TN58_9CLOT|nr:DUF3800 domain-containing protein [Clostridium gelidum]BCZ49280.1 hypothetical protein psyc5s11_53470 [Clostridium gelidum]
MINIYCDESCHLEMTENNKNEQKIMAIGGITCDAEKVKEINEKIRLIKKNYGINRAEIKWTKVSEPKLEFYKNIIDLFFEEDNLKFRVIIKDKREIYYTQYNHDDIYYIMYFYLLREMISINQENSIYIDKKDTRGGQRVQKLKEYLCHQKMDFDLKLINKIQIVTSSDCELMQLTDIFIGAITYANRLDDHRENTSNTKIELVNYIRLKTGLTLLNTVPISYSKFNIFVWN